METTPKIRCAIYTRKSTEDGLEQEFNSLDAQQDACSNYIASQKGLGWSEIPKQYDDGGFSGGNTERPALKMLIEDIKKGQVNCIVVYKIDRLTRSLTDFSKLIEVLDKYSVSFVSVTQSFDTSNSMGRLMLNVLLSFAQFEREVTGERIRDKIALSKKRGKWMGGQTPLGYNNHNKKLVVCEEEAKIIEVMFEYFIRTGSMVETVTYLNKMCFRTKTWISRTGKQHDGGVFDFKNTRRMLENPIYKGKIAHKGKIFDGEHEAIIDEETWQKVQDLIAHPEAREKIMESRMGPVPLLKGRLKCGCCDRNMTPTHTQKKNKQYRYYICTQKLKGRNKGCGVSRVPAAMIEDKVIEEIMLMLKSPELIARTMVVRKTDKVSDNDVIAAFKNIEQIWQELMHPEKRRIIELLIDKAELHPDKLEIFISPKGFANLATELVNKHEPGQIKPLADETIKITMDMVINKRVGKATVIEPNGAKLHKQGNLLNYEMINAFAKAHKWQEELNNGDYDSPQHLIQSKGLSEGHTHRILRLNQIAPDIVEGILDGRQHPQLRLIDFFRTPIPELWSDQREVFGF